VQNFSDLATFSVDFCILYAECLPYFYPVCLTYWPRKYTTRVDPHVDNSHQVWSWYDHPVTGYSVFVCWYVTWLCDLDLWSFDLEQLKYMAGHVTNLATKYELRVITLPIDYRWKCVCGYCACAESRDPPARGKKQLHFWNPPPRFAFSLCNFGGSRMKIIKVIYTTGVMANFLLKFRNFRYLGSRGWCDTNFVCIVKIHPPWKPYVWCKNWGHILSTSRVIVIFC